MLLAIATFLMSGLPAAAAPSPPEAGRDGESIPTYDIVLTVRPDGVVHIRETITYDFGAESEHGIVRTVPYRHKNRLYEIRDVRASSSTGAPARATLRKVLHDLQIGVGGEDRKVRGRQAYVIEYDLGRAITPYSGHDELRWDVIGTGWNVPIGEAAIRVVTPVGFAKVSCRAGAADLTTKCARERDGPYAVEFTQTGLQPHEGMVIRTVLPKGAVRVATPRYARPHFEGSWPAVIALAAVAVLVAVLVVWRRLRAPLWAGLAVSVTGLVLAGADVADDVLENGFWAASVGDPALIGLALIVVGAVAAWSSRWSRRPAVEDQS